jgi:hypothetical protein
MATLVDSGRESSDLGALIAAYLRAAEAGRTLNRAGRRYSPAEVRSLQRALAQVEAAAGPVGANLLGAMDAAALERLGWQVIDHGGLPPSRLGTIVDALRGLSAYTAAKPRPAEPRPPAEPAPWVDPPRRAAAERSHEQGPAAAPESRTPTFTMLALGAQVSAWTERIIVIAFALTVIGLALELL